MHYALVPHLQREFTDDMTVLGCRPPTVLTRVSEYIPEAGLRFLLEFSVSVLATNRAEKARQKRSSTHPTNTYTSAQSQVAPSHRQQHLQEHDRQQQAQQQEARPLQPSHKDERSLSLKRNGQPHMRYHRHNSQRAKSSSGPSRSELKSLRKLAFLFFSSKQ